MKVVMGKESTSRKAAHPLFLKFWLIFAPFTGTGLSSIAAVKHLNVERHS